MIQAEEANEFALSHSVCQEELTELTQSHKDLIKEIYKEEDLVLYTLPGGNICVPTLSNDEEKFSFTHVLDGKVSTITIAKLSPSFSLAGKKLSV